MTVPTMGQAISALRGAIGLILLLAAIGAHAIMTERDIVRQTETLDSLTVVVQQVSTLERHDTALLCALEPPAWRVEHRYQIPCEQVLAPVTAP